ncbi:hypothetical protein C8R46DRAFT_545908 [Mycena filopes]|nr:hypothetical protein C8R46DRAFT_545908 [Mycena filopes]
MFYAQRVRNMYSTGWRDGLWVEAVNLLHTSFPDAILLPKLRKLVWRATDPAVFPHIRMFLAPSLTSIDLSLAPSSSQFSILSYLASNLPSLTVISIHPDEFTGASGALSAEQMTEEFTAFILGLKDAQVLTVPAALPAAYQHLASLASLTDLDIDRLEVCSAPGDHSSNMPGFQALKHLSLRAANIQLIQNALRWCERTPLTYARFTCSASATAVAVGNLLTILGDSCIDDGLVDINIDFCGSDDIVRANPTAYEISAAVLRPLLVFSNLTDLRILSGLNFSLDDNFIDEISRAWPKIRRLAFRPCTDEKRIGSVTLSALRAFALHCPALEDLELTFDATTVPPEPHRAPRRPLVRQTCLTTLTVGYSPIGVPDLVARFLSATFPSLRSIGADSAETAEEEEELRRAGRSTFDKWAAVEALVPSLAAVRIEEEIFWRAHAEDSREMVATTA